MKLSAKMDNVKDFGFGRGVDYLRVNFWIMWKTLVEYKWNMWISFLEQVVFMVTYILFFYTISENFGVLIGWEFYDFLLLGLFTDSVFVLNGFFHWKQGLPKYIQTGRLNEFLPRPIHNLCGYLFSGITSTALVMFLINFITIPIIVMIFDIVIYNFILGFFVLVLIFLFHFGMRTFVSSLAFISYGLNESIYELLGNANFITRSYPAPYFERTGLYFFMNFIPLFFIGSMFIPLLRGYEIINLEFQISFLIVLIIVTFVLSLKIWDYGLKKYEAFG